MGRIGNQSSDFFIRLSKDIFIELIVISEQPNLSGTKTASDELICIAYPANNGSRIFHRST